MEPHTDALEIVCKHFKQEYGTEAMAKLKREKTCMASQNYRLRKKVETLEGRVKTLMLHNDRLFILHRKFVTHMSRARESLAIAIPYL